jgi:hypothetical protein
MTARLAPVSLCSFFFGGGGVRFLFLWEWALDRISTQPIATMSMPMSNIVIK